MHFLIINNGTASVKKIKKLLANNSFEEFNFYDDDLSDDLKRFDAVILSGGHALVLNYNKPAFAKEIDIVLKSNLPIFGICFGFQLIATAFGAEIIEMDKSKKGIFKINKNCEDDLFKNINDFYVYENHQRAIVDIPNELISLASSDDGIEIIKHKKKYIYGVQFHPETYTDETCGSKIFTNFLKNIEKQT